MTDQISPIPPNKLSDTSSSSPVVVSTPSVSSEPDHISLGTESRMEVSQGHTETQVDDAEKLKNKETAGSAAGDAPKVVTVSKKTSRKSRDDGKEKKGKKTKRKIAESSSSESDVDSESEKSEEERSRPRRKSKSKRALKKKTKAKRSKKYESSSNESTSDDSSSSESDTETKKIRRKSAKNKGKKTNKKVEDSSESDSTSSSSSSDTESEDKRTKRRRAKAKAKHARRRKEESSSSSSDPSSDEQPAAAIPSGLPVEPPAPGDDINTQVMKVNAILNNLKLKQLAATATKFEKPIKKNVLEYKRIDQVWDTKLRDYKLVESTAEQKDEFDCVFTVRRRFDWEGKHKETQVDIKSKLLRSALQQVFEECKSISLVEETPQIDPYTLFHYYDELTTFVKRTLKPKLRRAKRSKEKKQLTQQIAQVKLLLGYIDEDYAKTRKALKPMLKAGMITYDLVWALFKPNTIAYTPTYGNKDDPRCFKVDFSYEYESWLSGVKSWVVDGRYLEYDGKAFGFGDHQVRIEAFKGHKKITSLVAYPLKYHKDPDGIRKKLVERGKKFVALQGMNYRLQQGIAYMKHKMSVIRFNINGRVMIDPAIFRRINPNYQLSYIKHDELDHDEENEDGEESESESCDCSDEASDEEKEKEKMRLVMWRDNKGKKHPIKLPQSVIDQETGASPGEKMETDEEASGSKAHIFSEEELLIASPVVLGFAFSEKYWLEFSLSGIEEIKWNAEAFDSLVLPDRIKQNLKGLVSSHRFNAAKTIDDVIKGKGKGLNVVLHGPPGVGKTLTGESIAEYLRCPLYAVSAGELGTNSRSLEQDLNRIMDITHSWGAILLLDEADVFLEARQPHDIHRNSLVSVFLRLTEYYQGILFLTTNRVATFDEAFQSRIHMGIRYENLSPKARRKIWQHHVGKVEKMASQGEEQVKRFSDADFDELSKKVMNGRQIKNTVKTSQSIALAENAKFSMEHVKRVLEVAEAFEDDMRGGGYRDAMRQYT